jgi:hypothetical protein
MICIHMYMNMHPFFGRNLLLVRLLDSYIGAPVYGVVGTT